MTDKSARDEDELAAELGLPPVDRAMVQLSRADYAVGKGEGLQTAIDREVRAAALREAIEAVKEAIYPAGSDGAEMVAVAAIEALIERGTP